MSFGTSTSSNGDYTLTVEKLRKAIESIKKYDDLNPPGEWFYGSNMIDYNFMGMKIVTSPYVPPSQQKIKVRDIKFSDGTSILPRQWLDEQNEWWASEFGYESVAYVYGRTVFMDPASAVKIVGTHR